MDREEEITEAFIDGEWRPATNLKQGVEYLLRTRSAAPVGDAPTDDEREALSEFLFTVYDHGTQPNALREADAILTFLNARRPVQAEPTDAEVLASLNAWYAKEREQNGIALGSDADDLADYSPQSQDRMSAALRAAYATKEGENR